MTLLDSPVRVSGAGRTDAGRLSELAEAAAELAADLAALTVTRPVPLRCIAGGDAAVTADVVFAELAGLLAGHPTFRDGALGVLRRHDADRGTDFVGTLAAYFDAGCDVTEAARRLHVHRNTLRYRLQRIEQLAGTDLTVPLQRFTLELQVRLHSARQH
jgi:DNA-binding PucR family transcriptional regulator